MLVAFFAMWDTPSCSHLTGGRRVLQHVHRVWKEKKEKKEFALKKLCPKLRVCLTYFSTSALSRCVLCSKIFGLSAVKSSVAFVLPQLLELSVISNFGLFFSTGDDASKCDVGNEAAADAKVSTADCDEESMSVWIRRDSSFRFFAILLITM